MEFFSTISAAPLLVVQLFPPVIAGQLSELDEPDSSDISPPEGKDESMPVASAISDGIRSSLDSPRRSREFESDASSIISKFTETSPGPLGHTKISSRPNNRRSRITSSDIGVNTVPSRYEVQISSMVSFSKGDRIEWRQARRS
jgi:hypothetical protein